MGLGLFDGRPGRNDGPARCLETDDTATVLEMWDNGGVRLAHGRYRQAGASQVAGTRAEAEPVLPLGLHMVGEVKTVAERPTILPRPPAIDRDGHAAGRPAAEHQPVRAAW